MIVVPLHWWGKFHNCMLRWPVKVVWSHNSKSWKHVRSSWLDFQSWWQAVWSVSWLNSTWVLMTDTEQSHLPSPKWDFGSRTFFRLGVWAWTQLISHLSLQQPAARDHHVLAHPFFLCIELLVHHLDCMRDWKRVLATWKDWQWSDGSFHENNTLNPLGQLVKSVVQSWSF